MNNKIRLGLGLLAFSGTLGMFQTAHATEVPDELVYDGAPPSGAAIGAHTPAPTPTPDAHPGADTSGPTAIPCINDGGKVVNASAEEVCKAILPKCADLKKDTEAKVRDLLSWKIWGYYKGKDIDLSKSGNVDGKVTLEGTDMAAPICSVVGQTLKSNGSTADYEIRSQQMGDHKSCGARPNVIASLSGKKFRLVYENAGGAGSQWVAYMQGAYPWLIRKHTYDVLHSINSDMSNLDDVLKTAQMSKDIRDTMAKMKTFSKSLSKEAKASCDAKDSNLLQQCKAGSLSINDPVQRVCTLVKSQIAANDSALPNMIVYEIMQNRVYGQYDQIFGNILNFKNQTMKNLSGECSDTGGFLKLNRKKKLAKTASCYFSGEFCVNDSADVREAPASGKCQTNNKAIMLSNGSVANSFLGISLAGDKKTKNYGFAAVIERLIRHDVCGQNKISDDNVCDQAKVPSKPAGVQ
jgi:hypothetical protein